MNILEARNSRISGLWWHRKSKCSRKILRTCSRRRLMEFPAVLQASNSASVDGCQSQGPDKVLCMETAFSYGFMKDPLNSAGSKPRRTCGPNPSSFGHPGAGGCVAFGDPTRGIGFAYVMNQMEPGVLPNERALKPGRVLLRGWCLIRVFHSRSSLTVNQKALKKTAPQLVATCLPPSASLTLRRNSSTR
jgi:CubicO group peptidase (beta-lactamase class C family)